MLFHVGAWAFFPQSLLSMKSPLVAAACSIQGREVGRVRYTHPCVNPVSCQVPGGGGEANYIIQKNIEEGRYQTPKMAVTLAKILSNSQARFQCVLRCDILYLICEEKEQCNVVFEK